MNAKTQVNIDKLFYWVKLIIGIIALVVGIAGIILPILPGWILVFLGLELLGIKIVFIDNIKLYALRKLAENKRGKK